MTSGPDCQPAPPIRFKEVIQAERAHIASRRQALAAACPQAPGPRQTAREPTVGLALSGGGIRAASFALGAIEALSSLPAPKAQSRSLFSRIDYVSCVSGGSYAGCAVIFDIMRRGIRSAFVGLRDPGLAEMIGSVRGRSKFLSSRGWVDYLVVMVMWMYGFITGILIVLPFILAISALFVILVPEDIVVTQVIGLYAQAPIYLLVIGVILYLVFSFVLSSPTLRRRNWITAPRWSAFFIGCTVVLFLALQPILIRTNMPHGSIYDYLHDSSTLRRIVGLGIHEVLLAFGLLVLLIAALVGLIWRRERFLRKPSGTLKATFYSAGVQTCLFAILVVAPLFIWSLVLTFTRWGIVCAACPEREHHLAPRFVYAAAKTLAEWMAPFYRSTGLDQWSLFKTVAGAGFPAVHFVVLYVVVAIFLFIVAKYLIDTNATSFHRFYRDRIKACFLRGNPSTKSSSEETARISCLYGTISPYLLVNCTVNTVVKAGDIYRPVNEPFVISSRYVGNEATGYVPTTIFETSAGEDFDLATIAAISGAALSPVMGRYTVRSFRLLMSLMGFRLGYWIPNPGQVSRRTALPVGRRVDGFYFVREMFGLMGVKSRFLYITDGGHADNSGVFELLRRQCTTIVAVDAEADADGLFENLVYLLEFARARLETDILISCQTVGREGGTHCAVGEIHYPPRGNEPGTTGHLIYCKLSMTGDENWELLARRKATRNFPYISTANQNYDELLFNAYRMLGNHIVDRALTGRDKVEFPDGNVRPLTTADLEKFFLR